MSIFCNDCPDSQTRVHLVHGKAAVRTPDEQTPEGELRDEVSRLTSRLTEAEGLLRRCREVFGHGGSKLDIDMTLFLDAPKATP